MSNMWDDEDEFRDIPDEAQLDSNRQPRQAPPAQVPRPKANVSQVTQAAAAVGLEIENKERPSLEEVDLFPDGDPDEEEDYSAVLNDANLRIEQGRLYQMIMNHDIFQNMDAEPRAVQNVQREIRKFARERMEIMLGMRKETTVVERLEIDFPFNALEVEVLKQLAFTATKGASRHSDNYVPSVKRVSEELERVGPEKKKTLSPIGGSTAPRRMSAPIKQENKLPSKPTTPIKRTKMDLTIDQICAEEGIDRALLEENYNPLSTDVGNLSEADLLKRAQETAKRLSKRKTVKSANSLPMATYEQQTMLAAQRAESIGQSPGMSALIDKLKTMPVKNY